MMNLQSTTPLVDGGPEWLTFPFALIGGGVLVGLLILWWLASLAGRKARDARELRERDAAFYAAPEPAARPITPPQPRPEPEPVAAAPEPEPVVETVPEPVAEAEPEMLEGAPAREPEPEPLPEAPSAEAEPLPEAPSAEAEPIDASPAGEAHALTDPPVAAEGEAEISPAPEAEPEPVVETLPEPEPVVETAPEPVAEPQPLADEPIAAAAPLEASPAALAADLAEPTAEAEHVAVESAPELAAAEVAPEHEPEPEPAPAETEPAAAAPDELTRMKGVGPRLADRLNAVGVTSFAQIAALSPEEAVELDSKLGDFQGRLERDRWIEQAGFLANGDIAGFEERFGKL